MKSPFSIRILSMLVGSYLLLSVSPIQGQTKTQVGPENGTLLIVGVGAGKEMYERFITLA